MADQKTSRALKEYLWKKTAKGTWQKRWFETSGAFLTYYKSEGTKLLAALNLPQVGEITLLPESHEDGDSVFTIALHDRAYAIKAENRQKAEIWVENLKWRQAGNGADDIVPLPKDVKAEREEKVQEEASLTHVKPGDEKQPSKVAAPQTAIKRDSEPATQRQARRLENQERVSEACGGCNCSVM